MVAHAQIAIIGGGVMGCSLAYHLAKEGLRNIVLFEKAALTSGSTWHAAGQVTHSTNNDNLARMALHATELYPSLEQETGQSVTWHGCGSLRIAYTDEEIDWLQATLSLGKGLGIPMEMIDPPQIRALHPFYSLEGVKAALHTPDDGHVDPAGVTLALAAGARKHGVDIKTDTRVLGIEQEADGALRLETSSEGARERWRCERVVNAGGLYARQIAAWLGLDLPMANMLHHYFVTESVPEFAALTKELPVVRDDRHVSGYLRMEQQSGLIGIYEKKNPVTIWDDEVPWEEEHPLFDPDYERVAPWLQQGLERFSVLANLGIKRAVHGGITHPVDGNMLLGPSGVPNFWLCCGSSVGIGWGAGAGKYLAQWIVHGAADISMASFDPRRFGAKIDKEYRIAKAKEDYLLRHEIPFPHFDRPQCRPSHSKTTPLYERLKGQGAVYEDVYGWERAYFYARSESEARPIHSFRRSPLHAIVREEVAGVRANCGLADMSAFAKLEVYGREAASFLERVSSNALPQKEGDISLTYMIADNGRIEGEATCMRLAADRFYLVYAAVREAALLAWLQEQCRKGEGVAFDNVSEKRGVLLLAGPESRALLARCTNAPLDNEHFPWLSGKSLTVGSVEDVRAMRVSYTGELAWELHAPMVQLEQLYDFLQQAATTRPPVLFGTAALNALRMEKAYKSGKEITPEVTLSEACLLRFARKEGFQGAKASRTLARRWKIALLQLEEPPGALSEAEKIADPTGAESVWHEGACVGFVTSTGFGYGVGACLAWCYLPPMLCQPDTEVEVMVLETTRKARVTRGAVWDPANARIKS